MTNSKHTGREIKWPERNRTIVVAELLGEGGEGQVYAIRNDPGLAVKIYHEDRRPQGHMAQKLTAMEEKPPDFSHATPTNIPRVAWPTKVIKVRDGQQVIGTVMPLVDRSRTLPISHILTQTTRKISLPKHRVSESHFQAKRWDIAQNIITAVKALHAIECVIGDVNDENIMVDPGSGEISIVDCDAFQIKDYRNRTIHRCKVGREQFTAPELLTTLSQKQCRSRTCRKRSEQGKHKPDYSCLDRRPEHDMFGIGVILFKLFMNGAHPYNQKTDPSISSGATLKDLISSRQYPYDKNGPGRNATEINRRRYNELPPELQNLFLRTFA